MENFLNSNWHIRCQCPQCSAPVTFEEVDRIFACPFCKVRLFFSPGDFARYYLPSHKTLSDGLLFVPYWRFKGMLFKCRRYEINKEIIDATILAIEKLPLHYSLGLRPQAMRLEFVSPDIKGRLLMHDIPEDKVLSQIENRPVPTGGAGAEPPAFHKAFIGETISMIYTPIFIDKGTIFDGVLKRPVSALNLSDTDMLTADENLYKGMQFIPALCPDCGWDLNGEKDSIILYCSNCSSAWQVSGSGLKRVYFRVVSRQGTGMTYLPFWRIKAHVEGIDLKSYADLIKLANLPKAIKQEWYDEALYFWTPAFKAHPDLFLRAGRFLTIFQPKEDLSDNLPANSVHPVTLPVTEAEECIKIILADIAIAKKKVFPLLSNINIRPIETLLVYIPFTPEREDLLYPEARLIIPKNALKYGRNL